MSPTAHSDRRRRVRRHVDIFFYGLFMDADVLHGFGVRPTEPELASATGLELRIGARAALAPASAGRVHGVVMRLATDDIARLYGEPSVQAYEPQAILVELGRGGVGAALCYNLPTPPAADERNPEYAAKLRVVAAMVGLPADYVSRIGS